MSIKKEVEFLIGVPCSGKSSYLTKMYLENEIFIISRDNIRDDILKEQGLLYTDFFSQPREGETEHEKYGTVMENGMWSLVFELNKELNTRYLKMLSDAKIEILKGKKIVVDMLNLSAKGRRKLKSHFTLNKKNTDIKFSAVIFEYKDNLALIEKQLKVRAAEENKSISFNFVMSLVKNMKPLDESEFDCVTHVDGLSDLKKTIKNKNKKRPSV